MALNCQNFSNVKRIGRTGSRQNIESLPIDPFIVHAPALDARVNFYLVILNNKFSKPLKCVANPGGSGALMWFTHSGEYVIKTVDRGQAKFLHKMLTSYYMNIKENPDTLLTRFYGLYAVKMWNNPAKRIRIVVMKNFFPTGVKFDFKFDLKVRSLKK